MSDMTLMDAIILAILALAIFVLGFALAQSTDNKLTFEQCLKSTVILQEAIGEKL